MEFSPRAAELRKKLAGFCLITLPFFFIFFLFWTVPGFLYYKNIVASSGGGAALYYLFCARSYFSRVTTLYTLFMASNMLWVFTNPLEADLSIFILLTLSSSFLVAKFFHSNINLDPLFLVLSCGFLTLIGLEWSVAFLVELSILFVFEFWREKRIKKTGVFLSVSILLILCCYFHFLGVHPGLHIGVLFLFGTAGAGGLQFLCLNKTEWEQRAGLLIYFVINFLFGFLLQKEDVVLLDLTLLFLMTIFVCFLFIYLVSLIKDESLSAVITGSKTLLRGVFFPFLYLLNDRYLFGAYVLWISSFVIHVLILLLFKFIFHNEDQDPILENEEKGRR